MTRSQLLTSLPFILLIVLLSNSLIHARPLTTPVPPDPVERMDNSSNTLTLPNTELTQLKNSITKAIKAKELHLQRISQITVRYNTNPKLSTRLIQNTTQLRLLLEQTQKRIDLAQSKDQLRYAFRDYIKKQSKILIQLKKLLILYLKHILKTQILAKLELLVTKDTKLIARLQNKQLATPKLIKKSKNINQTFTQLQRLVEQLDENNKLQTIRKQLQTIQTLTYTFQQNQRELLIMLHEVLRQHPN